MCSPAARLRARQHLRSHAPGGSDRSTTVFKRRYAFFQHRDRGIADARVDVAEGLEIEQLAA